MAAKDVVSSVLFHFLIRHITASQIPVGEPGFNSLVFIELFTWFDFGEKNFLGKILENFHSKGS